MDSCINVVFIPAGAQSLGLSGAVGGYVLATIVSFPFKYFALNIELKQRHIELNYKIGKSQIPDLMRTLVPSMITGIAFYPFEWYAKLIIASQPNGFAQIGLFAAASSFGAIVAFIPAQLMATTQSLLGNLYGNREFGLIKRFIAFNMAISGIISLSVALVMSFSSGIIMRLYGSNFSDAKEVLICVALSNVFYALVMPNTRIMVTFDKLWVQSLFTAILGIILIISSFFFSHMGAFGLSVSYLIAWGSIFFYQSLYVRRLLKKCG
jgi:O-antigen/teichoic acid export membrane protein